MTNRDFLLPDLGEGLTEVEIVRWLVDVGDRVEVDQSLAEVETEKAVVEVPSPFEGTVTALHAEPGQEVAVGTPLVTVDTSQGGGAQEPGTASDEEETAEMVPGPEDGDDGDNGASGSVLVGYGTDGTTRSRRKRAAGASPAAASSNGPPASSDTRPLAKPPVRKMAKDLGIDLAEVPGSGPDGIITRDDVRAFADRGTAEAAPQAPPSQPTPEPSAARPGRTERVPLRGVRKRIAEKMTISRREIPEAVTWVDCDATDLMALRDELNASQDAVAVSPLAIILRACVAGLREYPQVNARLDTEAEEIVLQRFVHLGVAAHTDRGLVVPVIKDADRRSTLGIAAELTRLAAAAREGTLAPEDMTGGTFTVSNYGSFGMDGGSAVINHPEAAILGVGRISDRPWAVDGTLAVRKVVQLSVAFDHRICDGGEAAGFLRLVADCVESPTTLVGAL